MTIEDCRTYDGLQKIIREGHTTGGCQACLYRYELSGLAYEHDEGDVGCGHTEAAPIVELPAVEHGVLQRPTF